MSNLPAPGYKRIGIVVDAWKEGTFARALKSQMICYDRSTLTLARGEAPQVFFSIDIKEADFESTREVAMKLCKTCQINAHRSN